MVMMQRAVCPVPYVAEWLFGGRISPKSSRATRLSRGEVSLETLGWGKLLPTMHYQVWISTKQIDNIINTIFLLQDLRVSTQFSLRFHQIV